MTSMEEDLPGFDIEAYISNFSGHAKIDRLLFIQEKSVGQPLELEALRLAYDELKKGNNTSKYSQVVQLIDGRLGAAYTLDKAWVDAVDRRAASRLERLESELQSHKTNLIRESTRISHNDLGDFYYERGDLGNAFKSYVRARDYCTTNKHTLSMCLNVVRVATEMVNYINVASYVSRAEQSPEVSSDLITLGKLRSAAGLASLHAKKYKAAAKKFVEVPAEMGAAYNDVMSAQEVGVYGALTALATFSRDELQRLVISSLSFKEYLDLVPEIRELVSDFAASRYASCLQRLTAAQSWLLLDMHLYEHVLTLCDMVRQKAIVQYTTPFSSVSLTSMAASFATTVSDLEKELASLISEGQIHARIDSISKVLYACKPHLRSNTFQSLLTTGEAYEREMKALLIRVAMYQADLVQRPRKAGFEDMMPMPTDRHMGERRGGPGGSRRYDPRMTLVPSEPPRGFRVGTP